PGNALVDEALKRASEDPRFAEIKEGRWHTGDFDTIWFERGKIPSLTLSAQDENGLIPHLHRPEDTLRNVDPRLPALAVDFAEATVRSLAARLAV
ncbi:MAG: peptidase M28, partial [Deltaproteobacteria bacterium]|nr:peptidase M28 [Deltaproteobacteria bacterium]